MTDTTKPLIRLVSLGRVYRTETLETHALSSIDLEIHRGEYVTIEGPSGSGKSTLLTLLGLLDAPTSGEYELAGVPVAKIDAEERARLRNREIGFVFQAFNLIPEMTVAQNVGVPLLYRPGVTAAEQKAAVAEALECVGMTARADHRPSQLSGGQQQRVAVARASGEAFADSCGRADRFSSRRGARPPSCSRSSSGRSTTGSSTSRSTRSGGSRSFGPRA